MKTYSHKDIVSLKISNIEAFKWVKESFLLKKESMLPKKTSQVFNNNTNFYNTMPVIMPSIDSAGVKIVSRYSNRTPAIKGHILLYKYSNGEALAMLDADWITFTRTGAVAALAVEELAKKNAETVAIVGLGQTGKAFLDIYLTNKKNLKKTFKLKRYKDHAEKFKSYLVAKGVKNILICDTYESLIKDSDIIVSALTVSNTLLAKDHWFKEGVLVVPIHTRGFQNCDLFFDKVFADDKNHVIDFKYFNKFRQFEEIDKVLHQTIKGRESDNERIISYNIGIALHDIYFAKKIYDLFN